MFRRKAEAKKEASWAESNKNHRHSTLFKPAPPPDTQVDPPLPPRDQTLAEMQGKKEEEERQKLEAIIARLKLLLRSKKTVMNDKTRTKHKAVFLFMKMIYNRQDGDTRNSLAKAVSQGFSNSKWYYPRMIISWEIQ